MKKFWALHNCGRYSGDEWSKHSIVGSNCRMNEFQSALLLAQLKRLESQVVKRNRNGSYLSKHLSSIAGVFPQKSPARGVRHGYHLFPLRVDFATWGTTRNKVLKMLNAEGIPAYAGYPKPLYEQKALKEYENNKCSNCETICYKQGIWLNGQLLLGSKKDMDDIISSFRKIHNSMQFNLGKRRKNRSLNRTIVSDNPRKQKND